MSAGSDTVTVKTRGTLTIAIERCKGCDLCIPVCPPKVLDMSSAVNSKGFRYPMLRAGCTGCAACVMVCPDFCFEVFKYTTPIEHVVEIPAGDDSRRHAPHAPHPLHQRSHTGGPA